MNEVPFLRLSRTRTWIALGALLVALLALVDVQTTGPRVSVRWSPGLEDGARGSLESRYGLSNREQDAGDTWRYDLDNRSRDNIRALLADPAVDDTGYIDRDAFTVPRPAYRFAVRSLPYPFSDRFDRPSQLLQLHQTIWLLLAGGVVLAAARAASERTRRHAAVAALLVIGVLGVTVPLSPAFVHMGDAGQRTQTRRNFESRAAVHEVRFEAHLSYAVLGALDRAFGRTDEAPMRAHVALARATTVWFVLCAIAVGALDRWSPFVLRYLGLALLAPSALLYFGWLETGYHSLNVAAFPLLARGLRHVSWRLEAGSVLTGLGAAFHGFGLVSLLGAWLAALAARMRWVERAGALLRIAAWGTAAYVGWVAIYIIILKLPIDPGTAQSFPWRPWFSDVVLEGRRNAAIFSATGARDVLMTLWVVGSPLLLIAASLWRKYGDELRVAAAYAVPSLVFTIVVWPTQGLGEGMHLIFGRFPALYALAWVCAHDARRTNLAAAVLISGHYAFWRICLDPQFRNAALF